MKTSIVPDPILELFTQRLRKTLGNHIRGVIVYGSRARGDSLPESDYDVLVLVDEYSQVLEDKIDNIAWRLGDEKLVSIIALVVEETEFESDIYEPLFINIRREGVRV